MDRIVSTEALRTRIEGAFWGLLIGDALGVPYEFHHPSSLPDTDLLEMVPPATFHRAHLGTPPGTWSDDGSQALCLAASLIDRNELDLDDLGRQLVAWLDEGRWAVDGRVFDCGRGTRTTLARLRDGVSAQDSGNPEPFNNGNGALMRVLPLVLWHRGGMDELIRLACRQCLPAHRHPVAQVCCAVYCLVARQMLQGQAPDDAPWEAAFEAVKRHFHDNDDFRRALKTVLEYARRQDPMGSGYIVDQLWTCRWALGLGDYEHAIRSAIALGHDTDTSACIAGGLVGLRDGVEAIPLRWREALRGREMAEDVLNALLQRPSVWTEEGPSNHVTEKRPAGNVIDATADVHLSKAPKGRAWSFFRFW